MVPCLGLFLGALRASRRWCLGTNTDTGSKWPFSCLDSRLKVNEYQIFTFQGGFEQRRLHVCLNGILGGLKVPAWYQIVINHHNYNFAESLHYDVQDKDMYNDKDDNHAGDVERNNDYHDSAYTDADWDNNLLIPRMMSQTDRWAEAEEAKKH